MNTSKYICSVMSSIHICLKGHRFESRQASTRIEGLAVFINKIFDHIWENLPDHDLNPEDFSLVFGDWRVFERGYLTLFEGIALEAPQTREAKIRLYYN